MWKLLFMAVWFLFGAVPQKQVKEGELVFPECGYVTCKCGCTKTGDCTCPNGVPAKIMGGHK